MLFLATSFRISHIRLLGICFLYLSVVAATHAGCPLQISPQSVVVRYGDSASADCKALVTHIGMGWESTAGGVPLTTGRVTTWRVSKLTDWNIEPPFCYINYNNNQCTADLPVTIFKTPDSVSISAVNHTGPMIEGNQYELQCDIHNVAPVQNLTVNWYKGETLVNQTSFNDTIKSPVNKTTTLLIHPNRHDDGAQYRCEAELKLGEEGPQPPPNVTSDPFKITTVYFEPTINATNLPSTVSVVRGSKKVLYCIAEGNPRPTIIWSPSTNTDNNGAYTVTEFTPENLTCTATNSVGQDIKSVRVEIIDKENIMPIILGIIFAVLVVIAVTAVILTYHYKRSRIGKYSFMKPKAPKGLLAQPAQSP